MKKSPTTLILKALRGEELQDFSYLDYPPSEWSLAIAKALMMVILSPQTKTQIEGPRAYLKSIHVGSQLFQKWLPYTKEYPHILPHAAAMAESVILGSKNALERMYGSQGVKVGHGLLSGFEYEGQRHLQTWHQDYFDMRQTLESDEATAAQVMSLRLQHPSDWTENKEAYYLITQAAAHMWATLPVLHPEGESSTLEWFDPSTLSVQAVPMYFDTEQGNAYQVERAGNDETSGLLLNVTGSILSNAHEALDLPEQKSTYRLSVSFSLGNLYVQRPIHVHLHVQDEPYPELAFDALKPDVLPDMDFAPIKDAPPRKTTEVPATSKQLAIEQSLALELARRVGDTLNEWLCSEGMKHQMQRGRGGFEPSLTVQVHKSDPARNTVWQDTLAPAMQSLLVTLFQVKDPFNDAFVPQ